MIDISNLEWTASALLAAIAMTGAFISVVIGWLIAATVWITRHSDRLQKLEQLDAVERKECARGREECQQHTENEFGHGSQKFTDLQTSIKNLDDKQEQRHQMIMQHLLGQSAKTQ